MADSFFLLILPMRTLTIHLGSHGGCMGLSLRGACTSAADVQHLDHAIDQAITAHPQQVWVDCQELHSLSWLGQRAMMQADSRSRAAGITLHWCGLTKALVAQLASSGLHAVLSLLPAEGFRGPRFLLPQLARLASTARQQLAW